MKRYDENSHHPPNKPEENNIIDFNTLKFDDILLSDLTSTSEGSSISASEDETRVDELNEAQVRQNFISFLQ